MSDDFVEESIESPDVELGQAEVDGADAGVDVPILDIDQYRDYRIPVKVDGQEEYVPLDEARNGFMRQADYTRKTQEVAQQRQELGWASAMKAALDQDPAGTIQLLAAHYGVSTAQAQQIANQTASGAVDDYDDWLDDGWGSQRSAQTVDPRLDEIATRLARIEQAEQDAAFQRTIQTLQSNYPDFDPYVVVTEAVRRGTNDLEAVYKQMAFDRVEAERRQLAEQLAKTQAQRAAKQAASVVAGGSSAPTRGTDMVGEIRSISDAWEAAKRQLNG